jgi:hypothetical protein
MRGSLSPLMPALFLALLMAQAGPVAGTLAVLPAHSSAGVLLQGHDALVDGIVRGALDRGVSVVDVDVVRSTLVTLAGQGIRCADAECFARVGQFAGADVVIVPLVDDRVRQLLRVAVSDGSLELEVPIAEGGTAAAIGWVLDGAPPPALLTVIGPSGVTVIVDEEARGSLPLAAPMELAPGEHRVQLRADDARQSEVVSLTLAAAEKRTVSLKLTETSSAAAAAAADSAAADDDRGGSALLWAGVGVMAASTVVAVIAAAVGVVGYVGNSLGPAAPADVRFAAGLIGDITLTAAAIVFVAGVAGGASLIAVWSLDEE